MLTLEQALRRSAAVTLGLLAATGTAGAQGTPGTDDQPIQPCPESEPACPGPVSQAPPMPEPEPLPPVEPEPPPPAPQPTYTEPTYTETVEPEPESTLEQYGVAVSLGGGVEGFTDDLMRDTTDIGGNWDVRASIGTRSPIGFEASYIGSAQGIDALGLDEDTILVGNGLQGNVRVNLLDMNIQPFAIAGVAWRHYDLTNSDFNTSAIQDSDDVLEIPLGVGLAWKYEGFLLDARGEYRIASQEDLVPDLTGVDLGDTASLDRWSVNANIGYAF